MSENKGATIGEVFNIGLTDAKGDLLHIHIGSYSFEVVLNTAVECIKKIRENDPGFADEQMKKISDALVNGVKPYEGCYLVTKKNGDVENEKTS